MRAVRACLFALALAAASAISSPAPAGPLSAKQLADREEARTLANKGYDFFTAGEYERAIETFRKAEEHFHAPPHWLYVARSQAKLGQMLEAERSYRRIVDEKLAADAPGPFREAQAQARAELKELSDRMPSIVIRLTGEAAAQGKLQIDGADVAAGATTRLDPGNHVIFATAPGVVPISRDFAIEASRSEVVSIALNPPPKPSAAPMIVSFSLGGAALGAGVALQVLAVQKANEGTKTAPSDAKALQIGAIAGFAAGGAGITAGIVLAALRARRPPGVAREPGITFGVGVGSITVSGAF